MAIFQRIRAAVARLFVSKPKEDAWASPANSVTRAIESGRDLAAFEAERRTFAPLAAQPKLDLDLSALPPMAIEPARHVVIADDVGLALPGGLVASERPLEPAMEPKTKKRWWRRAA